jgi:ABC-type branched-subunit amino acid transport system permease subunit
MNDKFGSDEWVAQVDKRRAGSGFAGQMLARWNAIPLQWRFLGLLALAATIPFLTSSDYIIRVAGTVCLFATLVLGLNVVVGYAGLLDLGFIAFYGIGAYTYAFLSSPQFGLHWPSLLVLAIIAVLSVAMGLLLGSPSLRLLGDYLAIVTLGFGLVFVQLAISGDKFQLPWMAEPVNITNGTNGVIKIFPIDIFGFDFTTVTHYFFLLLIWLAVVTVILYRLDSSRYGRAWRAMREDPLAAEAMGMPTKQLKLMAFATGAAIAGVSGGLFAAWQGSVFPDNFSTDLLITFYAMMVLGGIGSLPGVILGAAVLGIVPEILRSPDTARVAFYVLLVLGLLLLFKPRRNGLAILIGIVVGGFILRFAVQALAPALLAPPVVTVQAASVTSDFARTSQAFGVLVQQWLVFPTNTLIIGNIGFLLLVPAMLAWSRMAAGRNKTILLAPLLYLLIFVWETRLSAEPAITRLLLIGSMLVVMMIFRPHGLLGTRRVEIV